MNEMRCSRSREWFGTGLLLDHSLGIARPADRFNPAIRVKTPPRTTSEFGIATRPLRPKAVFGLVLPQSDDEVFISDRRLRYDLLIATGGIRRLRFPWPPDFSDMLLRAIRSRARALLERRDPRTTGPVTRAARSTAAPAGNPDRP